MRSYGSTVRLNPERVRALRLARGWTQDQMAARSGLSQQWLTRAERFDAPYEIDKVAALAHAHGLGLRDLGVSEEDALRVQRAADAVEEARRILGLDGPDSGTLKTHCAKTTRPLVGV